MDFQNRKHHHAGIHGFDRRGKLATRMFANAQSTGAVHSATAIFGSNRQRQIKKESVVAFVDVDGHVLFDAGRFLVEH